MFVWEPQIPEVSHISLGKVIQSIQDIRYGAFLEDVDLYK
jgi:hypothetical protein